MYKRRLISNIILCILAPALVVSGYFLIKDGQYFITAILLIILSAIPFIISLERKKLQVRELVIMSTVTAIAVASRAAFFFVPQVKPMCAIVIISGIAFGSEFGFAVGALSVLISNFIFGQGMWTPFQMLGMGLTAYFSVLIVRKIKIKKRFIIAVISGVICTIIYGLIVDSSSVLMMVSDINLKSVLSIYVSGLPFNLIHGVTTAIIIFIIQPEINEKLERIKIKYGVFSEKNEKDIVN